MFPRNRVDGSIHQPLFRSWVSKSWTTLLYVRTCTYVLRSLIAAAVYVDVCSSCYIPVRLFDRFFFVLCVRVCVCVFFFFWSRGNTSTTTIFTSPRAFARRGLGAGATGGGADWTWTTPGMHPVWPEILRSFTHEDQDQTALTCPSSVVHAT